MPGKDPADPPSAAPPLAVPRADVVLKGLAGALATLVKARAKPVLAEPVLDQPQAMAGELDKTLRTVALIARAAVAVQALQAAEDKAEDRAEDRAAERAAKRAGAAARLDRHNPVHPEEDETDMNEHDPRLDTAEGVAEIYQSLQERLDGFWRRLESKHADHDHGREGRGLGPGPQLASEGAPVATAA